MNAPYFNQIDGAALAAAYPLGDDFTEGVGRISRDALRALQEERFRRIVARAWQIPFYQRLWGAAGLAPGDIAGLDDIEKIPVFDKADLMASIEAAPPLGDFHGIESAPEVRPIVHTTSGTTGAPQTLIYGPRSRELQNLLLARVYRLQGLVDSDVVHSVYGFGMINGGHYIRETILHWTGAMLLPAGTGNETSSAQQVALMARFGVTWIVGFADYLKRLAAVAEAEGLTLGADISPRAISCHLGLEDRAFLSAQWGGAAIYDWYGVGDTGVIAGEGPDQDGLYVMEDAHYLELLDIDSGRPVAEGERGDMVVSVLSKDDLYPIIRFNTHDVSRRRVGHSALGLSFDRIDGFLGRSDNMVKLKGINIFPQAFAPILESEPAFLGEFFCRAWRNAAGGEGMTVEIECAAPDDTALAESFVRLLRERVGITMEVVLCPPGALAAKTGIESRQKPIRLKDER